MRKDKIMAKGLTFVATHGATPEEKRTPRPFVVDLDMYMDLAPAGNSDMLEKTVNYEEAYNVVKHIVETETYNLIETLAETIARTFLEVFPIDGIDVAVYKPRAPIKGQFDYFAVKIYRSRQ